MSHCKSKLSQEVQSDLTVAIYDAVNAASMSFPFPQREIRIVSDHEPVPNGSCQQGSVEKLVEHPIAAHAKLKN